MSAALDAYLCGAGRVKGGLAALLLIQILVAGWCWAWWYRQASRNRGLEEVKLLAKACFDFGRCCRRRRPRAPLPC